jgi:hypothetical protein
MPRHLWLRYESPPHVDAVAYSADEAEVRLVLDLLARPYCVRVGLRDQLGSYLRQQQPRPPIARQAVPVRRAGGIYRLVPWRLAKWLFHCLPASDGVLETVRRRLETWLESDSTARVIGP